jgi:hypothetical protein
VARSRFHREQPAPMNIFEIAIRKLISSLGILRKTIVDAQMPFGVLIESVEANELILFIC